MAGAWDTAAKKWWERAQELHSDIIPKPVAYFLFQTFVGVWPQQSEELAGIAERLKAYAIKAMREAKQDTSWLAPDEDFEAALTRFIEQCLGDSRLVKAITEFVDEVRPRARHASLAMTMLKLTLPGIPDIYQGTELEDLSLVDPDNRRPVDFDRLALFEPEAVKQQLIRRILAIRGSDPELFARGTYEPLATEPGTIGFRRHLDGRSATVRVALRIDVNITAAASPEARQHACDRFPCGDIDLSEK